MMGILKWFFGIVGTIILIYVLIVMVRTVISSGFSTASQVATSTVGTTIASTSTNVANNLSTFSFTQWLANFHPFKFSPIYVGYDNGNSHSSFFGDSTYKTQNQLYWQNLNDAPDTHPTDWAPVRNNSAITNADNIVDDPSQVKASSKYIKVYYPENSSVTNSKVINGIAFNKVFSNRYFPVYVLDSEGEVLGNSKAFVNGDLQKNGFVNFRVVIEFNKNYQGPGFLMFKNENLDEAGFKAVTVLAVNLKQKQIKTNIQNSCVIGGCSMQLCGEQQDINNMVSTCEYRPEYACYQKAACERNGDTGRCGWRMDNSLASCLQYGR